VIRHVRVILNDPAARVHAVCGNMPIVSWFLASGLCLWIRLDHVRNAWRFSPSTCQTRRTTKQWTRQPRSTTNNLPTVMQL